MLVRVPSIAFRGISAESVTVEVNISNRGLPYFDIVGLPAKTIDESKHRIKAAFQNSNVKFPDKKITINLAPADIHKEGSFYDLPIALGIYCADRGLSIPKNSLFFGEVSLDGSIRHSKGAFLLSIFAKESGYKNVFVPTDCLNEAVSVSGVNAYPVTNLESLFSFIDGVGDIFPKKNRKTKKSLQKYDTSLLSSVVGQNYVKRALQIAAAGGHNIMLMGPPGSGKSLLSKAFSKLLPPLSEQESIEVTKIYSSVGMIPPKGSLVIERPFRSPHHTISYAGMIGGGSKVTPGEITLAHRGVLFMDEFSEFHRSVLESLRQPMEEGYVTISRSSGSWTFPSRFMLIAASNPCPCGYYGHREIECKCSESQIRKYQKKLSGPIMDRIDICAQVDPVKTKDLKVTNLKRATSIENKDTEILVKSIIDARKIQQARFKKENIFSNSEMTNNHISKYVSINREAEDFLSNVVTKFSLSARSYFKLIKVAKTIADLEECYEISVEHIAEATQYRFRF